MICTCISAVLLLGFTSLSFYLWFFNPNPGRGEPPMHWRHISLGHDINCAASNAENLASLFFFNGPCPNDTTMLGLTDTITGFEGCGIYYHVVINYSASKAMWWTLIISLWYPIIIFSILPAIFVIERLCGRKPASTKEASVEKRD